MKKSSHRFECRDDLWVRVQTLADRRGVSTDDVVEAALVHLFLKRPPSANVTAAAEVNGGARGDRGDNVTLEMPKTARGPVGARAAPASPLSRGPSTQPPASSPLASVPPSSGAAPGVVSKPPGTLGSRPLAPNTQHPTAQVSRSASSSGTHPRPDGLLNKPATAPPAPRPATGFGGGLGGDARSTQPPLPNGAAPATAGARPLYLHCEGQWYTIDQDQFVIGRGKKYSDMAIKDANISRRHCAIVRRDGEYFIKDLGSTNGIEYGGVRVDDHQIVEDSTYYLCNHELRFTFVAPRG